MSRRLLAIAVITAVLAIVILAVLRKSNDVPASAVLTTSKSGAPELYPPVEYSGAIDDEVTQSNIDSTVCVAGYTKTVRPPTTYTNGLKKSRFRQDTLNGSISDYELDHFIPLSLGGCARCPSNLWMEPWPAARKKDVVELYLHRELCKGHISLAEARKMVVDDWYAIYLRVPSRDVTRAGGISAE